MNDTQGLRLGASRHEATLRIRAAVRILGTGDRWPDLDREDVLSARDLLTAALEFIDAGKR